ncbi:G-type lectin S-receptor-like serine/threonine-protein kinase LECRK3 [Mangifera indica]|uniref:G-type lectin S-receptor-like serine/threonine-protein kinase LECRK3 n=1 Tax=Mangifera indica TaxID=29780 RepID=UPI001CFA6BED|nr:G-type lectin S-receptor-like serine/threonine-protein kinase LECRK3 [Mangifera indica]
MAVNLLLISSFVFLQQFSAIAQTNGNITVGRFLSAAENSSSWISPSGDFAFGFRPIDNSNELFLLSIWYDKIPSKTIVWFANGDKPAPRGSRVELTSDSGLVLRSPQGDELWNSDPVRNTVDLGVMSNTGNFELYSSSSDKAWESFRHPADTMLPSQTLESGELLSSKLSATNFSKGRFRMRMRPEGNLVLNTINLPTDSTNDPYYDTETTEATSSGERVAFNESGYFYLLLSNDQRHFLTSRSINPSAKDFYYRATINFDGVFTLYQHPRNSSNEGWTALWSIPDDICKASSTRIGSGTCGFNSFCRLNPGDNRPICDCPKGYLLSDPNNKYGDCKPNFTQSCAEDEEGSPADLYDFEEVINTDWPTSDYALLQTFTEKQCRESCLQDCKCAVAIFRSGDMCWKKKLPLSNGRFDNTLNGKALIKIRKGNPPSRGDPVLPRSDMKNQKNKDNVIIVGSVLLGGSVFFNVILVTAVCLCFFLVHKKVHRQITHHHDVVETNLRCFTYKELEEATDGFKEELGKGAFGIVYKGLIQMRYVTPVAVKKLNSLGTDAEKEFKTEVNVIGQTHHKNLVRLIGFCDDGVHHLLVYEFLSNGALASFLFSESKLKWSQRAQIGLGIARGLLYLHEECSTQIIHCDIKPQNILLDDYYTARISDFGLAKLLMLGQSYTHTNIRGTKGYVAPEWFRNLPITVKVDVFSFGVLLLEIICCRRNVNMEVNDAFALLTDWAYDCYYEERLDALVEFDMEALNDKKKVERFVMVALWCIQEDPSLRPTMRKVTQMLEGVVEVPVPSCPCPFSMTN